MTNYPLSIPSELLEEIHQLADENKMRQFKSEVHQRLIYLNRILQMVFYSQATFSVYC
jgi:hypothetical protein